MPVIHLTTFIQAPIERVFDLSRSIDLHKASMTKYGEEPIDGVTGGLINIDETVTWKARHFFKTRTLSSKITEFQRPFLFTDEMIKGDFKRIKHQHHFKSVENGTLMIDVFIYEVPFSLIGKCADILFLNLYMKKLLIDKNQILKTIAEGEQWKQFLKQ